MQIRSSTALLLLAASCLAQNLTVSPAGFAAVEGNSNNAYPFTETTIRRYMQIHDDLGTTPMFITRLSFRVNAEAFTYTGTRTFDMELFVGEANFGAALLPSLTYANNYHLRPTNVIPRTMITLGPTGRSTTPGPNRFTMDLPFVSPFRYSAAYPLAWEAAIHGATGSFLFSSLDADQSATTEAAQVITGTGCTASTQTTEGMTHAVYCADVGGTLHFGVTVAAGPNRSPCLLSLGASNPNLAVPGLCSNLLTDLAAVLPFGVTSSTGTITPDTAPFNVMIPNGMAGAIVFTQVQAIDLGRTDPIPVCNSNGRRVTFPTTNLIHVNRVARLWNDLGGATATQATFGIGIVGYGLITQFTH